MKQDIKTKKQLGVETDRDRLRRPDEPLRIVNREESCGRGQFP